MRTSKLTLVAAALVIGCGLSVPAAWAGYTVTLQQVGSNVVAIGSGPIDLSGLTLNAGTFTGQAVVNPSIAFIITGPASSTTGESYFGTVSGPTNFGSGLGAFAASGSGDFVGFSGPSGSPGRGTLFLPTGYASDTALSDSSTYNGTFSSLGVTPGTYEWTWGTGPDQNFTLIATVPEPKTASLLEGAVLFSALLYFRRRRSIR